MKSEFFAVFEKAIWPVLSVDSAGAILNANSSAHQCFGPALKKPNPSLSVIWSPENNVSPEQFLAYWELSPTLDSTIKLRLTESETKLYHAAILLLTHEHQNVFVIQLFAGKPSESPELKPVSGETTLVHRQKLDCALQLARTVSLDFNNALTSILGHTSLLLTQMEPNHPWRGSLLEVEKSAAKAAEVANDLGTFSRQEKEFRPQTSGNLNALLQRSVDFFRQNPGPDQVTWTLQFERKLFASKFDEARMQQVFTKIIENALQALDGSGRISVQTRNLTLSEPSQDRNVRLAAGSYICAEISDSGRGIKPDVLPRIFEPFFTTKEKDKHRGLGLAWVYGVVTNHGGGVAVSSRSGAGASVRVYLPAETSLVNEAEFSADSLRGNETVLLVDDEDLMLTMGQTILSAYGYRVLTANGGQAALDILAKQDEPVHLVITDLVMPTMSGRELIEHIQQISPESRILCISGYVWPVGQENPWAYLQKPFTAQALLHRVREVITAGS